MNTESVFIYIALFYYESPVMRLQAVIAGALQVRSNQLSLFYTLRLAEWSADGKLGS